MDASNAEEALNVHFLGIFAALKGLNLTKTTAAAGPTKAYRSPPSKDSQQLQAKKKTGGGG